LELPSREAYPDYYTVITQPIALDMIKQKISDDKYSALSEFLADMDLMFNNAKTYNQRGSQVYEDAVFMNVCFLLILPSDYSYFDLQLLDFRNYCTRKSRKYVQERVMTPGRREEGPSPQGKIPWSQNLNLFMFPFIVFLVSFLEVEEEF